MSKRAVKLPKFTEKKRKDLKNLILLEELTHYLEASEAKLYKRSCERGTEYYFSAPNSGEEISFVFTHKQQKRVNYSAKSLHLNNFLGHWAGFFESMGEGSFLEDLKEYHAWVISEESETSWTSEEIEDMQYILEILKSRV